MARTLLVCVVIVSALWFLDRESVLFSQQQPSKGVAKIGVVDLYAVSQKWKKWIDLADEVQKEVKAGQEKIDVEAQKVRDMEMKFARAGLAENSEAWLEEKTKVESARLRVAWLKETEEGRLENLATEYGKKLLAEIEEVIKKYGKENDFSLILKVDEIALEGRSWAQMQSYVKFKQVVYYEEGINVTPAIIKLLPEK